MDACLLLLCWLSTLADRQGVDISFTVCNFVRWLLMCTVADFSAEDKARRFIGIQGRESPILWNFAPPEAQNRMNRRVSMMYTYIHTYMHTGQPGHGRAHGPRVG